MLYGKDLISLTELLHAERSAQEKCHFYAEKLTDPETQELLSGLEKCHRMRFLALYELLAK